MNENNIIYGLFNLREERELARGSFEYIARDIFDIKNRYMSLGFHLHEALTMKYHEDFGYENFYEFCERNFKLEKSSVSRCMNVWLVFAERENNSRKMWIDKKYSDYSYSQLCELLTLKEEQRAQVKPEMSVKQIRELKKKWKCKSKESKDLEQKSIINQDAVEHVPELTEEKEFSAYGTIKRLYPSDSLLTTAGCYGGHDCLTCCLKCEIRQEERLCREACLANPFPCATVKMVDNLRIEIGDKCQFVNHELAYHRPGDGEPDPCCKKCMEPCSYGCLIASKARHKKEEEKSPNRKELSVATSQQPKSKEIKEEPAIINQSGGLDPDNEGIDLEEEIVVIDAEYREVKTEEENCFASQSEFPKLKNMEQREKWVLGYRSWPVWCQNQKVEEVFYRFDLPDGFAIVVKEYPEYVEWNNKEIERYDLFLLKPKYRHFMDCKSSMTEIKEHIKKL